MWDADTPPDRGLKQSSTLRKILLGTLLISFIGYIALPVAFKYSSTLIRNITFLNLVDNPFRPSLLNPSMNYGFIGARNFYLTSPDGKDLGVWHLLPSELQQEASTLQTDDPYNAKVAAHYHQWLQDAKVFVYCHGTAGSRASAGRIKLYSLLNSLGYHVVTFDYRGYGDSSGHPTTEHDVMMDARTVLDWVRGHVRGGNIFLWGHSLGSGVVSKLLFNLELEPDNPVVGAVLESSFNNLEDAIRAYPPSRAYTSLPGFDFFATEPITNQGITFRSEDYLTKVSLPLMFLHAKDDHIVPYKLGVKLYETVVKSRKDKSTVEFVSYNEDLGYGHTKIHEDPNLGGKIQEFVEKSIGRKTNHLYM
ncbi:lysophosphatidylserine lipase ABHD12-like [Macrosteles quadrilineatus]|uniref:lysophosphatidylserine lipase ABHD12-like n=1 Tax=Macrosteles quadrilineatus TaxID=74068 RepID=UPI0023E3448A|nr:lysophosphatidylserine lipase ABHD12-like [Macrosteles quadrilineatus]